MTHFILGENIALCLKTEAEYQRLLELLNALIDRVGEDETHPLASLMELVGDLIALYEDGNVPELA